LAQKTNQFPVDFPSNQAIEQWASTTHAGLGGSIVGLAHIPHGANYRPWCHFRYDDNAEYDLSAVLDIIVMIITNRHHRKHHHHHHHHHHQQLIPNKQPSASTASPLSPSSPSPDSPATNT
jgi:hypothetical protein